MKNLLKNKRGDGYIDVVVAVFAFMMLIILSLNVFTFLTIKQDMDYFAKEMVECATVDGRTSGATYDRYYELVDEVGFSPSYSWTATYYNPSYKTVQYGDTITVNLTYRTYVQGFGIFRIPITLTSNYSGLSQRYWK